ncbi:MAG: S8 family serine peptidase [Rhizobiaceae bacterium]
MTIHGLIRGHLVVCLFCLFLVACGGGGGETGTDGGEDGGSNSPIVDPTPPSELEPDPEPDPADPVKVDEVNLLEYILTAQSAWETYGAGGLTAVIDALEDDANDPRYDYEQVVAFVQSLPEYEKVLGTHDFGSQPLSEFDHPFTLTNVHKALAAGLTGYNQTIAIYDNGFDIHHPDLNGKNIDCGLSTGQHGAGDHGDCNDDSADDHGTATAVIAAGLPDEGGLLGVAPFADLVLFDWDNSDPTDSALNASDAGAVSYNNSWGFILNWDGFNGCIEDGNGHLNWQCFYVSDSKPAEEALNELLAKYGDVNHDYDDIVTSYNEFQHSGVIVFAKSNEDPGVRTDVYELPVDMPHFDSELQEAWISVINARIKTNGEGGVEEAIRDSAPCNLSAPWCLVGNGHLTYAIVSDPNEPNDDPYDSWTGTSFVAPQVAGAVALLAEAFPTLSPADLTARLLGTANNDWFVMPGGLKYDASLLGERCWNEGEANEFCHDYSREWGHGIMDMEAALQPAGDLYIVSGAQLSQASRAKLSTATLTSPTGSFNLLRQAFDLPLTTFDALNGNFAINTASLIVEQNTPSGAIALLRRFDSQQYSDNEQPVAGTLGEFSYSASHQTSAEGLPSEFALQHTSSKTGAHVGFGFTSSDVTTRFGGLAAAGQSINATGFAGLLGDTAYATLGIGRQGSAPGGLAGLAPNAHIKDGDGDGGGDGGGLAASFTAGLFGFTAENANNSDGQISGFGARLGVQFDNTQLEVSASLALEEGSYLGIAGDESVWFGGATSLAAGHIALTHDLGESLQISGRVEIGSLSGGADEGEVGLISQMDRTHYSGFELGLERTDLFVDDDALALWVSQPMRVEESDMTLTLASGRTKAGDIHYADYQTDITPEDRQIDVGLSYSIRSESGLSETRFGVLQSFNHGHVQDEYATSVAVKYSMQF